jgi:hypothetical protein
MKNKRIEVLALVVILIIQTIVYVICGIKKSYLHMDEAYSYGLANYSSLGIQDDDAFYDTWHDGSYYEDYLSVGEDEKYNFAPVYENQKNDVHPPFFYFLLRIAMNFHLNHYSKWPGLILNIIIFEAVTVFTYLILKKLLKDTKNAEIKALILSLVSAITLASISNVMYIRMYALSTLNILVTSYLHLKLLEQDKLNWKILVEIGLSAVAGSLTHYYYLVFLGVLFIEVLIKYIKNKQFKNIGLYTLTMVLAALTSLAIFPYSIKHIFFGYRGEQAAKNLLKIKKFLIKLFAYIHQLNFYAFNYVLYALLIFIIVLIIINKKKKFKIFKDTRINILFIPSIVYFLLVSAVSPYIELRYIMPVCNILFILTICKILYLVENVVTEKIAFKIFIVTNIIILLVPVVFKLKPQQIYADKKDLLDRLESELNVPTVYCFKTTNNRFLDDILCFTTLKESYIAKNVEYTEENINKILEGKDLSNGFLIFLTAPYNNQETIDTFMSATNMDEYDLVEYLNACSIYYIH